MTPVDPDEVSARAAALRARIADAGGDEVTVVAVTKTFDAGAIDAAIAAGFTDVGESYAQETLAKLPDVVGTPTLHFIGQLQRNKVRRLAPYVDVWQSVDRPEVASEIANRAPGARIMVQVDISGEETKAGVEAKGLGMLLDHSRELGLEVVGLMGVAVLAEPEAARPGFRRLRSLVDAHGLRHCCMGMTADLEVAIEEGSTMIRVGTQLFGKRVRH